MTDSERLAVIEARLENLEARSGITRNQLAEGRAVERVRAQERLAPAAGDAQGHLLQAFTKERS